MRNSNTPGPWLRRFLVEHLVSERNLARNTQLSYRDTLALLLPFAADRAGKPIERLAVPDLSAERVLDFLTWLARERGCSPQTCNQRLNAIRTFARFVGSRSPEHLEWCGQVRAIAPKKTAPPPVTYLEKPEIDALLAAPDRDTAQGQRAHMLLLFLYNTGARVSEATALTIHDLQLAEGAQEHSLATLRGKRGKIRHCPLWPRTAELLRELLAGRAGDDCVFLSRLGRPFTRFGMRALVRRCAAKAATQVPSLARKRVSPHVIRHSTATHLLRAGVDINTIRAWLGHVSLDTTNVYAEIDFETKAKAIACCDPAEPAPSGHWKEDEGLMAFLRAL